MFNKIVKYKFIISGALILILGAVFLGAMMRFIGFGPEKNVRRTLYETAKQCYLDGDYKKAVSAYEKLLVLEKDNADAILNLAIIYDDYIKLDEEAIELYREYIRLSPNSRKKALVEQWIKETANDSLGLKIETDEEKIKNLESSYAALKKENELLKIEVETLSGKLYTIQSEHAKEIKELQEERERILGELTNAKIRMGKLSTALSNSETVKQELLEKLGTIVSKQRQIKQEKLKSAVQK